MAGGVARRSAVCAVRTGRLHPSVAATYLAALVFYRVLYGELPGSFAVPAVADELAGAPMHLSDRDLQLLVSAANEVVAARPGCCEP